MQPQYLSSPGPTRTRPPGAEWTFRSSKQAFCGGWEYFRVLQHVTKHLHRSVRGAGENGKSWLSRWWLPQCPSHKS